MKKVLAIALSVIMMFAVCVPAFAANPITQDTEQSGQSTVKTDTSLVGAGSFEVSFPAQVDVMWGTEATNFDVAIKTHLEAGKTLSVTTAQDNAAMKLAADPSLTLAYTLSGDTAVTGVAPVADLTKVVTVNVATADWDNAPIGEYSDTVTLTVAVA